jgi:hypothetical protein
MAENNESSGLLAVIDAKIAALQKMREGIIEAMSLGALGQAELVDPGLLAATGSGVASTPAFGYPNAGGALDLPTGIFRDKGLADAIRLLLGTAKRKMAFKEIKTALLQGGLATTAEDFDPTLSGTLNRMKRQNELLQFKEGWDLASSYPDSFRQRLAQTTEAQPSPRRRRRRRKAAVAPTPKAQEKPKPKKAEGDHAPLKAVG